MPSTEIENSESSPPEVSDSKQTRHLLKRAGGGVLAVVGFILSPLSWWNDLLINIPLAYLFAGAITWMRPEWFNAALIIGYLLTNILGMVLMQYGVKHAAYSREPINFKKELKSSVVWSVIYTLLIVVLLQTGWIQPPLEYLR